MQLLKPLAVDHVRLATRYILYMPCVDENHFEAAPLEDLKQRDPVHAGGFHRNRGDAACSQPVGECEEILSERAEVANRMRVAISRYRYVVTAAADIDTGCIGMMMTRRARPFAAGSYLQSDLL